MRGKVLGVDGDTGLAQIAGDDGRRYAFAREDWKLAGAPRHGQEVDFQVRDGLAVSVFPLQAPVAPDAEPVAVSGRKSRVAAALLAFFFGALGVHKFYLGRTGAGLIMLACVLIGWILLFIPPVVVSVIAFIEFILYLLMSDEEFERRYVRGDRSWF
jgi:TM2 domain-containing membrane protein YozV